MGFFLAGCPEDRGLALAKQPLDPVGVTDEAADLVQPLDALVALEEGHPQTLTGPPNS